MNTRLPSLKTILRTLVKLLSIPLAFMGLGGTIFGLMGLFDANKPALIELSLIMALTSPYFLYVAYLTLFRFSPNTIKHLSFICAFFAFAGMGASTIELDPFADPIVVWSPFLVAVLCYFLAKIIFHQLLEDKPKHVDVSAPPKNESLPQAE